MARKECPKSKAWPDGCQNWVGISKTNPAGCAEDETKMNEGYGPFYVTTHCQRLGNASFPDRFAMVKTYAEAVDKICIWDEVAKLYPYYREDHSKVEHAKAVVGIIDASIERLKKEREKSLVHIREAEAEK